jgi:DNA ligase (NAD+)
MKKSEIKKILDDPDDYGRSVSIKKLIETLKKLSLNYYNTGKELVSDEIYDLLRNILEERSPNNPFLKEVGAPISKDKVKLPYYMPSLDKIKPDTNLLDKWKAKYKGPYVLSDKLDGVSGLFYKDSDNNIKLFTRGNGSKGQDISHLIAFVISKKVKFDKLPNLCAVRGELIISKKDFKKIEGKQMRKNGNPVKNARSAVAGIVNAKHFTKKVAQITNFVAYALISPQNKQIDQMKKLKRWGFEVVNNDIENDIDNEMLSKILINHRKTAKYEIDGIVVIDSSTIHNNTKTNPKYGFAFKTILMDQIIEATVVDVLWDASMHGYLKPRVKIEPVNLLGTEIKFATAFNGKFVKDNVLGPGAVIKLIKSGDVIPHIKEVLKPSASKKPKMPKCDYKWNKTNIDIIVDDCKLGSVQSDRILVKQITNFFKKMGVKYISHGIVTNFVSNDYKSVIDILKKKDELYNLEGLGEKSIDKIFANIDNAFKTSTLSQIMAASTIFGRGFGIRRTKMVTTEYPNILNEKWTEDVIISKLEQIDGFDTITATQFSNNFKNFKKFLSKLEKVANIKHLLKNYPQSIKKSTSLNLKFKGMIVVFTGVRDKELEKKIEKYGGRVSSNVSGNTTAVIYSDKSTTKYKNAVKKNIKTYTLKEFKKSLDCYNDL